MNIPGLVKEPIRMKKTVLFTFLVSLYLIPACKLNQASREKMLSQKDFPMTRADESTCIIRVNYYDTASYYDSPYQRFMLDNSTKPDGKLIVTDEQGMTRRTLYYKNHMRNGMDTWYYPNGDIMQQKNFVNNRFVSYKTFYPKRGLLETALDDTLGFMKKWDEMGNLIYEKNYVTGEFKQWDNDGKLRVKGVECPGECFTMQGPWYYYTPDEKLDQIVFYHGDTDPTAWDSIYHYSGNKVVSVERKLTPVR
jgi:hypothetical protein